MYFDIIIVAHHSRFSLANKLANDLDAKIFLDEENRGANWNHHQIIEYLHNEKKSGIVMEDDAIPVSNFKKYAQEWIDRFPDKIISFYLGRGRPPQYQSLIKSKIDKAIIEGMDYITLQNLIHGVSYYIPSSLTKNILRGWDNALPADFAIGKAYARNVIYPVYSLVEHSDIQSVEKHPDGKIRTETRKAWYLLN